VYNCPNTENIGSIKFISGSVASPDMNFIEPIFFHIRAIAHCVTNIIVCKWRDIVSCSENGEKKILSVITYFTVIHGLFYR
jgi:hypothetical protein